MRVKLNFETVYGSELKVGDTIKVWWNRSGDNTDTITNLREYKGRLSPLFPKGARLASFLLFNTGMTIDHAEDYERFRE